jgi:pheromone shutdown protein TraB
LVNLGHRDPEFLYDATRHYPLAKEREENIAKAVLAADGDVVCIVGLGHLHALKLLLKNALP